MELPTCEEGDDVRPAFFLCGPVDDGVLEACRFGDEEEGGILDGLAPLGHSLKLNISGCVYIVRSFVDLLDFDEGLIRDNGDIAVDIGTVGDGFFLEAVV